MRNNITFLISGLQGGGAEKICTVLANGFVKNNIQVDLLVLSLENAKLLKHLDNRVNLINLNTINARKSFFALKNYIADSNCKKFLVFNFQLAVLLIIIRMLFSFDYKVIARNVTTLSKHKEHIGSYWHSVIIDFLVKKFYYKVDHLIAQSEGMKEDLIKNYNFKKEKITVINNPINEHILAHKSEKNPIKNNEILFIGRLEKEKGLNYLLTAFSKINNQKYVLRLIGEGSLKDTLSNFTKQLGISDRVEFINFKDNLIPDILKAKVLILTSLYEGFPNVLIESIALGTPVVSFDCQSGPNEIIENGINGFLVDYLNLEDLKNKIDLSLEKQWNKDEIIQTSIKYHPNIIIKNYIQILGRI